MSRIPDDAVLALQPWVRLRHDGRRGCWVLLAPERVLFPCPITVDLLERLGSGRSLASLVSLMAEEYDAPEEEIRADLEDMLGGLLEQRYLTVEPGERPHA